MADALDRAAQAAFQAQGEVIPVAVTWGELGFSLQELYKHMAHAALQVMADEIRDLHKPCDCDGCRSGADTIPAQCGHCDHRNWPCQTVRIIDKFLGVVS